jgi:hypothetical protein
MRFPLTLPSPLRGEGDIENPLPRGGERAGRGGGPYFFTSGQSPWSMGRKACSAGMVARTL